VSIRIHLHKTHRRFTGGKETIEVEGKTVGECIGHLVGLYPEIEPALFAARGKLQNAIEIYLNGESAYPDELKRPTRDGDEIHITLILAGG
jgi:molybdopterin converting factor small subunit